MYYKITNQACEVYEKLRALRTKEKEIEKRNREAIDKKVQPEWKYYFGSHGQHSGFSRVTRYDGFIFLEPENVDAKIWIRHKKSLDVFIPNRRTKSGREMESFLKRLEKSDFRTVLEILQIDNDLIEFHFPFVEIAGDFIVLFLDDNMEPSDENIIEITKTEFYKILNGNN